MSDNFNQNNGWEILPVNEEAHQLPATKGKPKGLTLAGFICGAGSAAIYLFIITASLLMALLFPNAIFTLFLTNAIFPRMGMLILLPGVVGIILSIVALAKNGRSVLSILGIVLGGVSIVFIFLGTIIPPIGYW